MLFSTRKKSIKNVDITIKINGVPIERVRNTKFLGVIVDEKLSWSNHIDYVASKIAKNIGIICRVRKIFSGNLLRNLYYTFIYPYLLYCNAVWGLACTTQLRKIHIRQKRIIRIICGSGRKDESEPLFKKLKILNIYEINKLRLYLFSYKLCNSMYPDIMSSTLRYVSDVHSYNTRQSSDIYIPKPRTNFKKQTVYYQAAILWNSLPHNIRNSNSINVFKRLVFKLILDKIV